MKLAQYTKREVQITTTDAVGMRQRWMWGLRLLHDPEKFSPGSTQLVPGVREALIEAAKKRGIKLSDSEIGYRLQCARRYKTEAEFATAVANFPTWDRLRLARFPAFEAPAGEPPADWRTESERLHDLNRAWLDATNGMDAMFPLSMFEPIETTLEDLERYEKEQIALHEEISQGFMATHARRREYLDRLEDAADGDLSMMWQEAHDRLPDDAGADEDQADDENPE